MVWQTCLDNAVSDVADVVAACGTIETLDAGYTPNADLEKVLFLAEERALYPGKAPLTLTDNVESPLVRHRQQPSIRRFIAGAIAGGIGCGTAAALVDSESAITRAGATWATLALCVLVFIGIVISFVDHDTLFLDLPTLLVGGLAAWVLAVVKPAEAAFRGDYAGAGASASIGCGGSSGDDSWGGGSWGGAGAGLRARLTRLAAYYAVSLALNVAMVASALGKYWASHEAAPPPPSSPPSPSIAAPLPAAPAVPAPAEVAASAAAPGARCGGR